MSDINWKDGAICFAYNKQWFFRNDKYNDLISLDESGFANSYNAVVRDDFQLNEIREGDFIPASELDTEQKYNEVVEVFGLFGYAEHEAHRGYNKHNGLYFAATNSGYCYSVVNNGRQLTYHQIIAIGKLKRMMLEREKSAPKTTTDLTADFTKASSNKYEREITDRQGNSATVDVYDVLKAFEVTCPATQHAVKKLLCSGLRGHKDLQTDLVEAKESIVRAIELN